MAERSVTHATFVIERSYSAAAGRERGTGDLLEALGKSLESE